ncbi:MAG: D-2-hydroxyacid dehydrogenase [Candidatus Latescibacterota bacterium]|nr:D-2-hydroxyacid dehydrogenase [Candidatus Latescibacterota bacterium]
MSYKLVFLPAIGDRHREWAAEIRQAVPDIEVVLAESREQALFALADAQAAFGALDPELLAAAPQLQWLAAPAAGPSPGFYFDELIASDVTVTNQRGIYNDHIAAHILSYVLAFARGLHFYLPAQVRNEWLKDGPDTLHLPEATVVIIGVGGIGGETARHCAHFGMHVIAIDPRVKESPQGVHELYRPDALDDHIGRGDFVIITAPQTPTMQSFMNRDQLAKMKNTGILINIGRGSNVVLDDLADALYNGAIGGAALDVFEIEPLPTDHRLWNAPNFLMTPHVAGIGPYLDDRRLQLLIDNCRRLRDGENLINIVDKANWF